MAAQPLLELRAAVAGNAGPLDPTLEQAMASLGAEGNPFLHMRYGQVLFDAGELDAAAEQLAAAYAVAGVDVFEAEDETLGRRVALKILNRTYSRDAARLEQFRQEALITASITHPNVITLYSVGYDQGYFYLAMELVGGGSLEQRIRRENKLTEGDALRIGHEVAEGLRAAQHQGLIHRDVKPANILFTETGTAKVVDFGLALFTDRGPDKSAEIWATPYYVAPEKILQNEEDYRSDIFSLGATLFHALTGSPPHQVDTHAIEELRRIKSRRVTLGDSGLRFAALGVLVGGGLVSFWGPAREDAGVLIAGSRTDFANGTRVIFLPATSLSAVWHERTASPLTCTVHAPQRPAPQPNFVPVICNCSRITQSSGVSLAASTDTFRPLMLIVGIFCVSPPVHDIAYGDDYIEVVRSPRTGR